MISLSTFTVILYAILCHCRVFGAAISDSAVPQILDFQETVDQTPIAATCTPEKAARVFGAILYINLISSHDPEVVFGLSLPSDIAADLYYQEKLRILTEKGFDNAEELASISASAILLGDEFTISYFYFASANTIGEFLYENGFLNCDNVIQRVNEYFDEEQRLFESLGSDVFESYLGAILIALDHLVLELGYTLEKNKDVWVTLTELFYKNYSKYIRLLAIY